MLNDITQYDTRYELWSLENCDDYPDNFYKFYVNDEYVGCVNLVGESINIDDDLANYVNIPIDLSPDLIPAWLNN